jgi:hypothetical protein
VKNLRLFLSVKLLLLFVLVVFTFQSQASDLSNYYVGRIYDAEPANEASEVVYINDLITLGPGAGQTLINGKDYDRLLSKLNNLPTAVYAGNSGNIEAGNIFDGTDYVFNADYAYVLGKYSVDSYVWYIGNVADDEDIILPATMGGHALSHATGFNPVSEPGTMLLLGSGLLGLSLVRRRRFRRK